MAIGTGLNSAGLEDWEEERKKYEDRSTIISSTSIEEHEAEQEKLKDGPTI